MMKRLLILVTILGLTVHFCDVQGSVKRSREKQQALLNRQLIEATRITGGNLETIRGLLHAGANVNAANNFGWTALMSATWRGNRDVVELLLKAGAHVNTITNDGGTVLMYAVLGGNRDVVELLLNAKADVNVVDNNGRTIIDEARTPEIRELLKRYKDALTIIPIAEPFDVQECRESVRR